MKFHSSLKYFPLFFGSLLLGGCSDGDLIPNSEVDSSGAFPATEFTARKNERMLNLLPFSDNQDFIDARRGFIAKDNNLRIVASDGKVIWDRTAYDFIDGKSAPASVNPSLWRQAQLNNIHGLFEVTNGIYQLRGFDLANITLIKGDSGWIVVDPLSSAETAEYAMQFAGEHLGDLTISAIIFTHSHIDHFGGVLGAIAGAKGVSDTLRIIAPEGFVDESVSENVLAGQTMKRRAEYMYGMPLPRSERGHLDSGLGKEPSFGTLGILKPTDTVSESGQSLIIDGLEFFFQIVSGSEAASELTFYIPEKKAFCGAELLSRNMHNLYTLRGAKVRDALAWSAFIDEAADMFSEAEIYFGSHHWPVWGKSRIATFLETQSDTYKYIHDQTLRLAYKGYTPVEIAEDLKLPASLQKEFSNRGYYGTLVHNSRAVYQRYFGWYDGNPANLNPLPPVEESRRYIALMGGPDKVLEHAMKYFDDGEYRWAATLLNHLVFTEPNSKAAKNLLARNYEQLGYQAESGPWRDAYLTAAHELRNGITSPSLDLGLAKDMVVQSPRENFFDVMAAQLNGPEAEGIEMTINFVFSDLNETHLITLKNSVLHHRQGTADPSANATVNITHDLFLDIVLGKASIKEILLSGKLTIDGSKLDLLKFFSLQDTFKDVFPIVTP